MMETENIQNKLPKNDTEVTIQVIKEEMTSDVEDSLVNNQNVPEDVQIKDELEIKNEQIMFGNYATKGLGAREVQTTNVITVRIRKKRGEPRKSDPYRLYSPDMFQSLFGFSVFNCQKDSEWRDVLKKKGGSLHFKSNGTRISDPQVDVKLIRTYQQKRSRKKVVKKNKKIISEVKVNYTAQQKVVDMKETKEIYHEGKRRFQCAFCYMHFKERNHCKKHMDQVHFKIRHHKCDHCDSAFYAVAGLKKHVESVHLKLKPYKCEICSQSFGTTNTLKTHQITHEKTAQYECPICGKKIRHKQTYDEHLNIHANIKFTCTICLKSYSTKKVLGHHLLTHNPNSKYDAKCSKCNRSFLDKFSLRKHERYAHSPFIYQCSLCEKSFHAHNNLKKHIQHTHASVDHSMKCEHCNASFKNKDYLKNHISRLHTDTLHCLHCPSTFPNKERLACHLRSKHGTYTYRPFKCKLCDRHYIKNSHLKRHMKSHEKKAMSNVKLSCDNCGKQYKLKIALQKHIHVCK